MFQVDDTVAYGASGICRVTGVTKQKSGKNLVQYYVLKPVYNQGSTIFVPTENETLVGKMRRILSADEIMSMIHALPEAGEIWLENESERQACYREILQSGDRSKILQVIRSLYLHQIRCKEAGRKFRVSDERIMKDAENILHEEFSFVLGVPKDQIASFIGKELSA